MDKSVEALIGMACLALLALIAFVVYRRRQQQRIRRVEQWVRDYLVRRDGELAADLRIHCSADERWPVLASFRSRQDGTCHRLQFDCGGPPSTFVLLSEKKE
jgi:hypothetical protein